MTTIAKRVFNDASEDERFWNLSDGERLVWMIERAHQIGRGERAKGRTSNNAANGRRRVISRKGNGAARD